MLRGPGGARVRDRLTEFLPLLLAGFVLLVFQFSRSGANLPLLPAAAPTATVARAVITPPPLSVRPAATRTPLTDSCTSARPRFTGGMASLKAALGSAMGDPLECEHAIDQRGNTQQQTTTGLAYYLKELNAACFTTGWDHWSLLSGAVVHWSGDAVAPPASAGGTDL
jgi:hypothetical protein